MSALDAHIARALEEAGDDALPAAGSQDPFEAPSTYRGWAFFTRWALASRYMRVKARLLDVQRLERRVPLEPRAFRRRLARVFRSLAAVSGRGRASAALLALARARTFYAGLAMFFLVAAAFVVAQHKQRALAQIFAESVPAYANALHVRTERIASGLAAADEPLERRQVATELEAHRQRILSGLDAYPAARKSMATALASIAGTSVDTRKVREAFNALNKTLRAGSVHYAVDPRVYVRSCRAFASEPMSALRKTAVRPREATLCHTTALRTFRVRAIKTYAHSSHHYDVLVTERLDRGRQRGGMLGFYAEGASVSQVLRDLIQEHTDATLHAALRFPPESVIVPDWMRDRFGIEPEFADALRRWVDGVEKRGTSRAMLEGAEKDAMRAPPASRWARWWQGLSAALGEHLDTDKLFASMRDDTRRAGWPRAERTLAQTFAEAVTRHEVQHQINAREGLATPAWADAMLDDVSLPELRETTIDEVSAYLVSLGHGEDISFLLLGELLAAGLDVLVEMQSAHYAAQVIISELAAAREGLAVPSKRLSRPKALVAAYRSLAGEDLPALARRAYVRLFERPFPVTTEIRAVRL